MLAPADFRQFLVNQAVYRTLIKLAQLSAEDKIMGNAISKTVEAAPPEEAASAGGRCVNYLVNSYSDIKDVIFTVEKLIAQTPITDKSELRQACEVNIIPLQGRSGYLFRVKLHDAVLRQL